MCSHQFQRADALITSQNYGTILVMVAWFLACLLAFLIASRVINRCRSQRLRQLPLSDDAIIITASLCAMGSTITISTAVHSGLGKQGCLLNATEKEQIQAKVFISTLLFVLAISLSKCPILLYIHQIAGDTFYRTGIVAVSFLVLLWTVAVIIGIVFQCEMPNPWEIWTGKCIPLFLFWLAATIIDIIIDTIMVLIAACKIWTLRLGYRRAALVTAVLSFRLFLVATASVRLMYLQRVFSDSADPTFDFIPYAITTQCHSTLSVMLAYSTMLKPLTTLLQAARSQLQQPKTRNCKHWSSTTIGGTPYASYDSFARNLEIVKEPLPAIQASMSNRNSPTTSRDSIPHDILLPEILLPSKYKKVPSRPPPPAEHQRPDLSMFTKKTALGEQPMVTRLGRDGDNERFKAHVKLGESRSLGARALVK